MKHKYYSDIPIHNLKFPFCQLYFIIVLYIAKYYVMYNIQGAYESL